MYNTDGRVIVVVDVENKQFYMDTEWPKRVWRTYQYLKHQCKEMVEGFVPVGEAPDQERKKAKSQQRPKRGQARPGKINRSR